MISCDFDLADLFAYLCCNNIISKFTAENAVHCMIDDKIV